MLKTYGYLPVLSLLLIFAIIIALLVGSKYIPINEIFNSNPVIINLRLPRVISAITVGALLSIAGLLIQNLVKNPLADPYILGLSGATASVQLTLISLGVVLPYWLFVSVGFFAAMLSLLFLLALSAKGRLKTDKLLLSGVVIAFAYGAIISLVLTLSPLSSTKPMLFWLMGDLSFSQLTFVPIVVLLVGLFWSFKYHKELDLLARGDFFAQKSGVDVKKINWIILLTTSVFTAIAVSLAGTIGFIGLVVPHIARLLVGNNHALLIPLSAIIGAIVLLIADTLARTIVAPIQLPVGIFTALFGIPVFLFLLKNKT